MLLIDERDGPDMEHKASQELMRYIRQRGVSASGQLLQYGDVAMEGLGPNGSSIMIGFERKTIRDMLSCIDDNRLVAHQLVGMKKMYAASYVIIEGLWKSDENGLLMEGFRQGQSWGWMKFRGASVMYSKLYRYLISLQLAGFGIVYSQSIMHTAFNLCEYYHYFQKRWTDHKAMMEMQKISLPTADSKPSLARQWAACLDGVGSDLSSRVDVEFGSALELAIATPEDWAAVKGISLDGGKKIVKQIERRRK